MKLYTNNLKNRKFDKEALQIFCSDRVAIAERQGASENKKSEEQPRQSKTNSSSCLYIYWSFLCILLLFSCVSQKNQNDVGGIVSIQLIDRNGFAETISSKDRLTTYEKTNFLNSQPYQKVLRVFGRTKNGQSFSKITAYHSNGQLWQYLEVVDGRAHGMYREWYPNGKIKLEAHVIEGTPDVTEMAQMTWLFEDKSYVWDEEGHLIAQIPYEKGMLEGKALYYHTNGKLSKQIPYHKDEIDGTLIVYNEDEAIIEQMEYTKGLKNGSSLGFWDKESLYTNNLKNREFDKKSPQIFCSEQVNIAERQDVSENKKYETQPTRSKTDSSSCLCISYKEFYDKGLLLTASYYNHEKKLLCEIKNGSGRQALFKNGKLYSFVEHKDGSPEGEVRLFDENNYLTALYHIKDGKKYGEEWEYYPSQEKSLKPKLCLHWDDDVIQGVAKTWYENGMLESQRELSSNKKHGLCFAWFKEGDLMLMEEYEDDILVKGSYFKKWEKKPVSKVENGKGVATLYDSDGHFVRKIAYDKGVPQGD